MSFNIRRPQIFFGNVVDGTAQAANSSFIKFITPQIKNEVPGPSLKSQLPQDKFEKNSDMDNDIAPNANIEPSNNSGKEESKIYAPDTDIADKESDTSDTDTVKVSKEAKTPEKENIIEKSLNNHAEMRKRALQMAKNGELVPPPKEKIPAILKHFTEPNEMKSKLQEMFLIPGILEDPKFYNDMVEGVIINDEYRQRQGDEALYSIMHPEEL